jgi:hypothetical protein
MSTLGKRSWFDSSIPRPSLAWIQHGVFACGKFAKQQWPEILLAISIGGLAYRFWSRWAR